MKNVTIKVPERKELSIGLGDILLCTGPLYQKSARSSDDLYLLTPTLLMAVAYSTIEEYKLSLLRYVDFYLLGTDDSTTIYTDTSLESSPSKRYITLSNSRQELLVNSTKALDIINTLAIHQRYQPGDADIIDGIEVYTRIIRMEIGHIAKSAPLFSLGTRQPDISKWPKQAIWRWMIAHLELGGTFASSLEKRLGARNTVVSDVITDAVKRHILNNTTRAANPEKNKKSKLTFSGGMVSNNFIRVSATASTSPDTISIRSTEGGTAEIRIENGEYIIDVRESPFLSFNEPNILKLRTRMLDRDYNRVSDILRSRQRGQLHFNNYYIGTLFLSGMMASDTLRKWGRGHIIHLQIFSSYEDRTTLYLAVKKEEVHFMYFLRAVALQTGLVSLDNRIDRKILELMALEESRCRRVGNRPAFLDISDEVEHNIVPKHMYFDEAANCEDVAVADPEPALNIYQDPYANADFNVENMTVDIPYLRNTTNISVEDITTFGGQPQTVMIKWPDPADPVPVLGHISNAQINNDRPLVNLSCPIFEAKGIINIKNAGPGSIFFEPDIVQVNFDSLSIDVDSYVDIAELMTTFIRESMCYILLGEWTILLVDEEMPVEVDEEAPPGLHIPVLFKDKNHDITIKYMGYAVSVNYNIETKRGNFFEYLKLLGYTRTGDLIAIPKKVQVQGGGV